jgi:hypothetical protein
MVDSSMRDYSSEPTKQQERGTAALPIALNCHYFLENS